MRNRGFTLLELITVMAIMAILMTIATLSWNEMQVKAAVETQIKLMFADMMEVRLQALYTKTPRAVKIVGQQFNIYATDDVSATPLSTKALRYPVVFNGAGTTITFDAQGLTNGTERSLCILPTNDTTVVNTAAVDSIVVSAARMNLGKRNGGNCASVNIDQK